MLAKLTIKNVALIEQADIVFQEGLNVLSGETGAGKSVILDSVNFVLGAKAERSMIRYGETECMVKAEFFLDESHKAITALRELDIDSDGEIIISRRFSDLGKNTIKINGSTVTVSMLRKVTDCLVDVHGQSEHFFLLKESNQLKLLDSVVGTPLTEKKQELSQLLQEKHQIDEQIAVLGGDETERARRLELLRYQIEEITQVNLKEGEEEELISRRNKLMNVEKIINALREAEFALSADGGVLDGLQASYRAIRMIAKLDDEYEALADKIEAIKVESEELCSLLSDAGEELYFDDNEAEFIESRLDAIRSLKRKYGADKTQIDSYLQAIQAEYDLLSDCEGQYEKLMSNRGKALKSIYKLCKEMTKLRQQVGNEFCLQVVDELRTLNMAKPQFAVQFSEYTEEDAEHATQNGLDEITFLFSANTGEPMKPLGKIISGGEMSRFMLAIKTRLSGVNGISTYIFDEIDAGISGQTAKVVGEKLVKIAKTTQIIAVSHLAQIVSMSDCEYLIDKQEMDGKTTTNVLLLDANGRKKEIVRLLGGSETDEFAYKHAQELLNYAEEYKKSIS